MVKSKLSDCFKLNFMSLKIFGLWPGREFGYYKFTQLYLSLLIFLLIIFPFCELLFYYKNRFTYEQGIIIICGSSCVW